MELELVVIAAIFFGFVVLEILYTRFFKKPGQTPSDGLVEGGSAATLILATQPAAVAGGVALGALFFPSQAGTLASWPFLAVFCLFLVFDDMSQYWWHRLSHTVPWLYKLHRPHHNAEYLSVRVVYRNNVFYYLMMPGIWLSGMLIYLGGGWVYAVYLPIKMAVIIGAHSDVRWDQKLYDIPWLSPVMWVVERTISTPATHSAHHGKHADDGVTHYKGNYGNLLFLWDVIFGTAKITRRYPHKFGVENLPDTSAAEQLFWPLVRTSAPVRDVSASLHVK
jgi:sterol desaturase/sphingolipid hydroxylase (fatty acid hydroxylase superfamily)